MEIQPLSNMPYVKLDKENCTLIIQGRSYPEHPIPFYEPILKELEECHEHMRESTINIKLALEIMNSVSAKYIYYIIKTTYDSSKQINIEWYYEEDDEDMLEEGKLMEQSFPNSNFTLISVEDLMEI